jgi:RNA polymerase sigma-70 factor (ECF subfamily)
MPEPADENLLRSAREGDAAALEQLLLRHQPRVYRFGMRLCRNPEDARDVLQETLLAMARTFKDFRGASSVSTWLYTIARSFCIMKRRRSAFAPEREESLEALPKAERDRLRAVAPSPEQAAADRELHAALEAAIASLEPIHREALVLRDVEGLTAPEAAEVLGISSEAVKSRLHRARVAVRDALGPLLGAPREAPAASCPDVLTLLSRRLEDEISADGCARLEEHIESCGRCRGACESLKRTLALCRAVPAPEVPAAVRESVRSALRRFLDQRPPS